MRNEIARVLADLGPPSGIFVTGPQGVSKSHSLVALVTRLEACDSAYHVTFIPHCAKWTTLWEFVEYILSSFGSTPNDVGWPMGSDLDARLAATKKLVSCIDEKLATKGKQWIFVIDQINTLFRDKTHHECPDVFSLQYPYKFIGTIMKFGRITSYFPLRRTMRCPREQLVPALRGTCCK